MVDIYELEDKEREEEEQVNSSLPVQPTGTRNLLLNFAGEQEKEPFNLDLGMYLASKPQPHSGHIYPEVAGSPAIRTGSSLELSLHLKDQRVRQSEPADDNNNNNRKPHSAEQSRSKKRFAGVLGEADLELGLPKASRHDSDEQHTSISGSKKRSYADVVRSPAYQMGSSLDPFSSLTDQRVHPSLHHSAKPVDANSSSSRKISVFILPDTVPKFGDPSVPDFWVPYPEEPVDDDASSSSDQHQPLMLPVGFRFRPTDEQLIAAYLNIKIADPTVHCSFIPVSKELYNKHPQSILGHSRERSRYFFIELKRAKLNASRSVKDIGVWQNDSNDKPVSDISGVIGKKVNLCFYSGQGNTLTRTKFLMKEFVSEKPSTWVLCYLYELTKKNG